MGRVLVAFQFALFAAVMLTGEILARGVWSGLQGIGIIVGTWAILAQGVGNFNIRPDVKEGSRLITRGPYALIRHPMYTSLLAIAGGAVGYDPSVLRIGLLIALAAVLVTKLLYEESRLRAHFSEYTEYMRRTKRLIPWVW